MQVAYDLFEPARPDEPHTVNMVVSPQMTPQDVVTRIIQIQQD